DYRACDIAALAAAGERFDAVLALEIVEHVADRDAFLAAIGALVRPGGVFIGATLNRTARSFALAVVGAEYVLGWLPRGTHDWRKFVKPAELEALLSQQGFRVEERCGVELNPLSMQWRIARGVGTTYLQFHRAAK